MKFEIVSKGVLTSPDSVSSMQQTPHDRQDDKIFKTALLISLIIASLSQV